MGQSAGMLVLVAPVLSTAITTAAVAWSIRVRRFLTREVLASRAAIVLGLFATAIEIGWLPGAVVTASLGVLVGCALWTARPVRRRWGNPLPRGPQWDWDRFDAAFRAHVDRLERRQRPRGSGPGSGDA